MIFKLTGRLQCFLLLTLLGALDVAASQLESDTGIKASFQADVVSATSQQTSLHRYCMHRRFLLAK